MSKGAIQSLKARGLRHSRQLDHEIGLDGNGTGPGFPSFLFTSPGQLPDPVNPPINASD